MNRRWLRFLVFCSGLVLMLVQIVSSRVIAPYLGTSVYTWTNVIGTTLFGMVLGNYFGGLLSERAKSRKIFGLSFVAAGTALVLSSFLISIVDRTLGPLPMHIAMKTALYTLAAFFPAAFFLSTIVPQAFAFDVEELKTTGSHFGSLYAWSSLGNVVGLLSGGFFLIHTLGTRHLLAIAAVLLVVLGLVVGRGHALWKNKLSALVAVFFIGAIFLPTPCLTETDYYCINISKLKLDDGRITETLRLDHLVHSYVSPDDPSVLGYGYEEVYAHLIASRFDQQEPFRALFVGGGGYVLPRYIDAFYPNAHSVVAEIDPGVTKINYEKLALPTSDRMETQNLDARRYLAQTDQRFDLVFGDAFNDFTVPFHLTTLEFHQLLKSHMTENGVYALNVIDDRDHGMFLASMIRTLREVWTYVYVAPQADRFVDGRNTYALIATDQPIDETTWYSVASFTSGKPLSLGQSGSLFTLLDQEQVDAFLAEHPEPVLHDDFVPVDRYLAPVFREAY